MQHDDLLDSFVRALRGVSTVRPVHRELTGLAAWALAGAPATTPQGVDAAAPAERGEDGWLGGGTGAALVEWREDAAPDPGRLRAVNRSPVPLVVAAGDVIAGGMADRAAAATTEVAPAQHAAVRVVPLGARWWREGELRARGALSPASAGLVLQATLGSGPAAASARTLLRAPRVVEAHRRRRSGAVEAGWALLDRDGLVALWLLDRAVHRGAAQRPGGAAWGGAGRDLLPRLVERGARRGELMLHGSEVASGRRMLAAVPRGPRLVDHLIAAGEVAA